MPSTIAAFEKYGILTARALESRKEIAYEYYVKSVNVEANTVIEMAKTIIYPAAMRYQGELADTAAKLKAAGLEADTTVLEKVTETAKALLVGVGKVESALNHGENGSTEGHAKHFKEAVLPAMLEVRAAADALEGANRVRQQLFPGHVCAWQAVEQTFSIHRYRTTAQVPGYRTGDPSGGTHRPLAAAGRSL